MKYTISKRINNRTVGHMWEWTVRDDRGKMVGVYSSQRAAREIIAQLSVCSDCGWPIDAGGFCTAPLSMAD